MNTRKATLLLFKRYKNKFILTDDLQKLCEKGIIEIDTYPIDKLSRWLGFIQGYVCSTNQTTIKLERDISRPLFHKAYQREGLEIPITFDTKDLK